MPLPASTVVALPFKASLRPDDTINPQRDLERMRDQAHSLFKAMAHGLIALSGRLPAHADEEDFTAVAAIRQRLGLPPSAHAEPHWIYRFLCDALPVALPAVPKAALLQQIQVQGWTIQAPTESEVEAEAAGKPVTITATRATAPTKKEAAEGRSTIETVEFYCDVYKVDDGRVHAVGRDFRNRTKGTLWDAAAAAGTLVLVADEISAASSGPYYFGSWTIDGRKPPAKMAQIVPDLAASLDREMANAFPAARAIIATWRQEVAKTISQPADSEEVLSELRQCVVAIAYEVLKSVSSWVALDRLAAEERAARVAIADTAIKNRLTTKERQEAVRAVVAAIETRAERLVSEDPTHIAISVDSLDWRTCQAFVRKLNGEDFGYLRGDQVRPWSHPDAESLLQDLEGAAHRQALLDLCGAGVDPHAEQATLSLAELLRSIERAAGRAKLTLPPRTRIHVDRQSAGTTGTLRTEVDKNDANRLRGERGKIEGTPVILGSVSWLGRELQLRWHVGRNRSLIMENRKTSWIATFSQNARRRHALVGELKSFDIDVQDDGVQVVLPLNIDLPAYQDLATRKSLALGSHYFSRPGSDPLQPDSKKTTPPQQATVLAVDLGRAPLAGWTVMKKDGDRYQEIASALIGEDDLPPTELFVPGIYLHDIKAQLRLAANVRAELRAQERARVDRANAKAGKPVRAYGNQAKTALRRSFIATVEEGALLEGIDAIGSDQPTWAAIVPRAIETLTTVIAPLAVSSVSAGFSMKVGRSQLLGRGEQAAAQQSVYIDQALASTVQEEAAGSPHLQQILRALLHPIASMLMALQRAKAVRLDIRQVTLRNSGGEAAMNAKRNEIARRHGFTGEAQVWHLLTFGIDDANELHHFRSEAEGLGLQRRLELSDQIEDVYSLGSSLSGWGKAPLRRGEVPPHDDPRAIWREEWGFLLTRSADQRHDVHQVLARRIMDIAQEKGISTVVMENLDLGMSTRHSAEENLLARRLAVREWQDMIARAADIAGIHLVLADSLYATREIVLLSEDGRITAREIGIRHEGAVRDFLGLGQKDHIRIHAARTLALRSLSGYQERVRFRVQLWRTPNGDLATLRPSSPDGKYAAWQDRFATSLGFAGAKSLTFALGDDGFATPTESSPSLGSISTGDDWLCAVGELNSQRRWMRQIDYDAHFEKLTAQVKAARA